MRAKRRNHHFWVFLSLVIGSLLGNALIISCREQDAEPVCGDRICDQEEMYETCPADCEAWKDDFVSRDPRWIWEYDAGTGYDRLGMIDSVSVAEIGITAQSTSSAYSDCSLNERNPSHEFGVFESRLRCTHNNVDTGQGTTGWGFWNRMDNYHYEAAWFLACSPESDPRLHGLQAMVLNEGNVVFQHVLDIDMRQWHIYRVEMLPEGTYFYVDGRLVASTPHRVRDGIKPEMLWWIDNFEVHYFPGGYQVGLLDVHQDQKMYIDWVKYYER